MINSYPVKFYTKGYNPFSINLRFIPRVGDRIKFESLVREVKAMYFNLETEEFIVTLEEVA